MFKAIHIYLQMYLKIFFERCIEIYELYQAKFLSAPGLAWEICLKKQK